MKLLVDTKQLSHEEWLNWRRNGIGGSDAAAIAGLNPYKSPVEVWAEKTSEKQEEKPDNESMRIGRDLEEYVASRFTEATGKKVRRKNAIVQSDEYPFMIANIDRTIVGENALLECKTTSPYNDDKWTDGKCPVEYEIQCHHYMAVTGAVKVYLVCLILGRRFVIVEIDRDEELIETLCKIESDFWEKYVSSVTMPPPDGSKSSDEIIGQMYPEGNPDIFVGLDYMQGKLDRYDEIKDMIGLLDKEKKQIEQEIKMEMGDAEAAYIGERKISWRMPKQSYTVDSKKLKHEKPEIYDQYKKPRKISRTFRITPKKEVEDDE